MLQSFIVGFAVIVLALTFGVNNVIAFGIESRIVEGQYTTIEEFPYQAYISHQNQTHCGGSILNKLTILTAAHCIALVHRENLAVRVGVTDVSKSGGATRKVAKAIVHEHYDDQTVENDIAILILDQPLDYTDSSKPIRLPGKDEEVPAGTKAFVSGWGLVGPGKETSSILKFAEKSVVSRKECSEYENIGSKMMCAGRGSGRPCNSDSGGPLVIFDEQHQPVLVGIVSFGSGCETQKPDVYTQVSSYIDWIRQRMQ